MEKHGNLTEQPPARILALGNFDGVHLGHQALLRQAAALASQAGCRAAALVFSDDPDDMLAGHPVVGRLTDNEEKRSLFARCGIEETIFIPFDPQTAALSPEAFVAFCRERFGAKGFVCGFNYRFGCRAAGDAALLASLSREEGLLCRVVPGVEIDGEPVSATRIRRLLLQGEAEAAARLLGRPYSFRGQVAHGKRLGSSLGFPTINLPLSPVRLLPGAGVYVTEAILGGKSYPAVSNLGVRPTVESCGAPNLETFLLDAQGQWYGQEAEIRLLHRLRPERKFDSVDDLRAAIAENARQAKDYFQNNALQTGKAMV